MKSPLRHLRRFPGSKREKGKKRAMNTLPHDASVNNVLSLGVGTFPTDGEITFKTIGHVGGVAAAITSTYVRKSSTFMRMADLEILATDLSPVEEKQSSERHYDYPSAEPPPGVERDPKEKWVALDTGTGASNHAPIAPYAVDALCMGGYNSAMDRTMWNADKKTEKILGECQEWSSLAWSKDGGAAAPPPKGSDHEHSVLIWAGQFQHGLYGKSNADICAY